MKKSKLNNLELVHLNIWLNMMQKYGYRMCKRWTDKRTGYLNFKRDSFRQFLNHVEQFGVYKTFVGLQNPHGPFNIDNCFWSTEEVDYDKYEYKAPKTKIKSLNKNKKKSDHIENTKVINLIDFKNKQK